MKEDILTKKKEKKKHDAEWGDKVTSKKKKKMNNAMNKRLWREVLRCNPGINLDACVVLSWVYASFRCIQILCICQSSL